MKAIRALQQLGIGKPIPFAKENATDIHILYVAPPFTIDGYYRILLPYIELGKQEGFATRMTRVAKPDFNQAYGLEENALTQEELEWADYVVFSMLVDDCSYLFRAIKALYPHLELVMDITQSIFHLPKEHPDHKKITVVQRQTLLENLKYMDLCTAADQELLDFLETKLLSDSGSEAPIFLAVPYLISPVGYEEFAASASQNKTATRIGIPYEVGCHQALEWLQKILKELHEKSNDPLEFVLFNCTAKESKMQALFSELPLTVVSAQPLLRYFQGLQDLQLDLLLYPYRQVEHHRSYALYLELAVLGIPFVAAAKSQYAALISDQEDGLLLTTATHWSEALLKLLKAPEVARQLGQAAKINVWKAHSFNRTHVAYYERLFS